MGSQFLQLLVGFIHLMDSSNDNLQRTNFGLLYFAKIVHDSDDIQSFKRISNKIFLIGYNLLILDSIQPNKGTVNECLSIRNS